MTKSYHNTNLERGRTLAASESLCGHQERVVLGVFKQSDGLTPCQAWDRLGCEDFGLLTSMRRSITNLTTLGLLVKTDKRIEGIYGKMVHIWEYPGPKEGLFE